MKLIFIVCIIFFWRRNQSNFKQYCSIEFRDESSINVYFLNACSVKWHVCNFKILRISHLGLLSLSLFAHLLCVHIVSKSQFDTVYVYYYEIRHSWGSAFWVFNCYFSLNLLSDINHVWLKSLLCGQQEDRTVSIHMSKLTHCIVSATWKCFFKDPQAQEEEDKSEMAELSESQPLCLLFHKN